MSRNEFTKPTKREALKRAAGFCEANGGLYGLSEGQRCHRAISLGVEFDHIILDANSHDNSISNCYAICIPCHRYKTAKHDIPVAAKTLRQQDKNVGIRKRSTFPGSRTSGWKRKMDGTVERRS